MPLGVIFPDSDAPSQNVVLYSHDKAIEIAQKSEIPRNLIVPLIIGCVAYWSNGDDVPHKMGFGYYLLNEPPFGIIDSKAANISEKLLNLVPVPWATWAE